MRDLIEAWGRRRWPGARVVHELVVADCRIDMAFISADHLAGVEIKSSRDVMTRLDRQIETFREHLPEVWLAYAPRWLPVLGYDGGNRRLGSGIGHIIVSDAVDEMIPFSATSRRGYPRKAVIDEMITSKMLNLLWRDEAFAIAQRTGAVKVNSRSSLQAMKPALARALTGGQIVREVCRSLRDRDAFWKADQPMGEAA
ncbi:hypothetical protein [Kaistia sp. MMO-174]|uniref:hypothetical protein n=1 Tax=Kaistia sp. MMO-174 TaxID=3081256 RepID=UPI003019790A